MIHGKNIIGYSLSSEGEQTIKSFAPATQSILDGEFYIATNNEVNKAVELSSKAFKAYRNVSGKQKALFLDTIAEEIENLGEELIQRASRETGLPEARIIGERGRTIGQLKMFAQHVRNGSWVDAAIDTAISDRTPVPRPDIRRMLKPVGPVVVFTASNFPLAFSTAGGDTASALAAGCPVIVKAHESHLGTNQLIAVAIQKAAKKTQMPDGVFSSLNGSGYKLGKNLVSHPLVKSVAFTGSFKGGKAIMEIASQREEPIPVFTEMGSINPVLLCPNKLKNEAKELAGILASSITLGSGQFCTNPGLIIAIEGPELDTLLLQMKKAISEILPATMLNPAIAKNYALKSKEFLSIRGTDLIAQSNKQGSELEGRPAVATVKASEFIKNPGFHEEVFGPFSLVVKCNDKSELSEVVNTLKGQLTTSVFATPKDVSSLNEIILELQEICGRLIFNAAPTGVEVGHAMQHGGPFPASSDSRFTSVGSDAIKRFVRPQAFQSAPQEFLPDELKDENPLGIWRKVNGELTMKKIK